jgi:altronate dehydratase large subunit
MMGQFEGFRRASGRPGVRNLTLVLSVTGLTTPAARRIGMILKGVTVLGTPFGSGVLGRDREVQRRALSAFASHPNVGAVVVIGADQPVVDLVAGAAAASGRLVEAICFDDCGHDVLTLTDRAVRVAAGFVRELSVARREHLAAGELLLGLECGRSDPSSGLVANPLLGVLVDRLVDAGGTAIFGETTEWIGAEGPLLARAATPEVADAICAAAAARERMAVTAGIDLTYNNPSTTNIEAGLSSIEEKSLGAIAKGGSRPIQGVIDYAAPPPGRGVWAMDAPAYAPESVTGFTAAGASMALFTTGVGNSYVSALAPTLKVTGNPATAARVTQQIDFDASPVFSGAESLEAAADRLQARLLEIASGALTWGEVLSESDEVISRFGSVL